MTLMRVLPFTKYLLEQSVTIGDNVIDATAGNGYDTLFLAQLTAGSGKVYAFDIQEDAVHATRDRVKEFDNVDVILDSHANIGRYVKDEIGAAVFNLAICRKATTASLQKRKQRCPPSTVCPLAQKKRPRCDRHLFRARRWQRGTGCGDDYALQLPQTKFDVLKYQFINQQHSP
ncbi:hypothetical protein BB776_04770, partial [Planococcus salinarum]